MGCGELVSLFRVCDCIFRFFFLLVWDVSLTEDESCGDFDIPNILLTSLSKVPYVFKKTNDELRHAAITFFCPSSCNLRAMVWRSWGNARAPALFGWKLGWLAWRKVLPESCLEFWENLPGQASWELFVWLDVWPEKANE